MVTVNGDGDGDGDCRLVNGDSDSEWWCGSLMTCNSFKLSAPFLFGGNSTALPSFATDLLKTKLMPLFLLSPKEESEGIIQPTQISFVIGGLVVGDLGIISHNHKTIISTVWEAPNQKKKNWKRNTT